MGYVLADKKNIDKIRDQLPEWNLSVVSEEIMIALSELIDEDKIKRAVEKIRAEREFLSEGLKKRDIKIYPSDAVYITYKGKEDLYDKMLEKGILIRDCSDFEGLDKGIFRVAVKGRKENEEFLTILDEVI
jgi:histidinol-phosphate/aromatic aminotransferase/cobyric acid decarboxylase-like protein